MYARRLEKLGIKTFEDFLYHVPSRYDNFSLISKINRVQPGEVVTIQGEVLEINNEFTKNFKRLQKAKITDDTGTIEVVWFNQPYLTKVIHAQGERAAAETLAEAARIMQEEPAALQLRYLQTMVEMSGEKNSTIIPITLDILGALSGAKNLIPR